MSCHPRDGYCWHFVEISSIIVCLSFVRSCALPCTRDTHNTHDAITPPERITPTMKCN